ncbi:hypothetical protein AAVH_41916, partial [Aphelenchoides avenae]
MPAAIPGDRLNGLTLDEHLFDSGLTLSWLLDTLGKHCAEFRFLKAKGPLR